MHAVHLEDDRFFNLYDLLLESKSYSDPKQSSSSFQYYNVVSHRRSIFGIVIIDNQGSPVSGVIITSDSSLSFTSTSFFDQPIQYHENPNHNKVSHRSALKLVLSYLSDNVESTASYSVGESFQGSPLSSLGLHLLSFAPSISIKFQTIIDLRFDIDSLWKDISKGYKKNIKDSLKIYEHIIYDCDNITLEIWNQFVHLHLFVAGFKTRSDLSWQLQYDMVINKEAFLSCSFSKDDGSMLSASFFTYSSSHGFYAVSASNRSFFNKSVSHGSFWQAMTYLKELSIPYLLCGDREFPGVTVDQLSDKLLNISNQKKSFGGSCYPYLLITSPL